MDGENQPEIRRGASVRSRLGAAAALSQQDGSAVKSFAPWLLVAFVVRLAERLRQIHEPAPDPDVADPVIGTDQLDRLAARHDVVVEPLRRRLGEAAPSGGIGAAAFFSIEAVKEVRDRDVQHLRELVQPARPDAVGAALVLLDLLERDADRLRELLLAHAEQGTAHAEPRADMDVDRVRALAAATAAAGTLHRVGHGALSSAAVAIAAASPVKPSSLIRFSPDQG